MEQEPPDEFKNIQTYHFLFSITKDNHVTLAAWSLDHAAI